MYPVVRMKQSQCVIQAQYFRIFHIAILILMCTFKNMLHFRNTFHILFTVLCVSLQNNQKRRYNPHANLENFNYIIDVNLYLNNGVKK